MQALCVSEDELLDLPVNERIAVLRKRAGISHDTLAERLGTSRQVVIGWQRSEKPSQASQRFVEGLAKEFGYPESTFVRPKEEELTLAILGGRLEELGDGLRELVHELRQELADVNARVLALEQRARPRTRRSAGSGS